MNLMQSSHTIFSYSKVHLKLIHFFVLSLIEVILQIYQKNIMNELNKKKLEDQIESILKIKGSNWIKKELEDKIKPK